MSCAAVVVTFLRLIVMRITRGASGGFADAGDGLEAEHCGRGTGRGGWYEIPGTGQALPLWTLALAVAVLCGGTWGHSGGGVSLSQVGPLVVRFGSLTCPEAGSYDQDWDEGEKKFASQQQEKRQKRDVPRGSQVKHADCLGLTRVMTGHQLIPVTLLPWEGCCQWGEPSMMATLAQAVQMSVSLELEAPLPSGLAGPLSAVLTHWA
ncbi:hypothetical protein E2C01_045944 [Portunus trituberculatus]|uniref:Uncharacterized protein n=1 Tax=Portunus trituberculatus TaxID=210409 RepID=A0A5B7G6B7_PORTR|nr:hypothetical protein [Portunus trituberculatus]